MARPKGRRYTTHVSTRVPEGYVVRLKRQAALREQQMTELIREAIRDWLIRAERQWRGVGS